MDRSVNRCESIRILRSKKKKEKKKKKNLLISSPSQIIQTCGVINIDNMGREEEMFRFVVKFNHCRKEMGVLVLWMLCMAHLVEATTAPCSRKLSALVEDPQIILRYYDGPLLSGPGPIPVYVIWYGKFTHSQRAIIRDFFASFKLPVSITSKAPTVRTWWNLTAGYVDANGQGISPCVELAGELNRLGIEKRISESDIEQLVLNSTFPKNASAAYFVLTSADITVETFCASSCGSHDYTFPDPKLTGGQQLAFAWVGNSASQCPGQCAWPFARAEFGPPLELNAPNGDVGVDGMIVTIAALLAGIATNPYNTGYYQGDAMAPLEAATACAGIYGPGAYPGYPGSLLHCRKTNASFNAVGVNDRGFLLPALWLPSNFTCTPPPTP